MKNDSLLNDIPTWFKIAWVFALALGLGFMGVVIWAIVSLVGSVGC